MSLLDLLRQVASRLASRVRSIVPDVLARLRSLTSALTGRSEDAELAEEIRFHIEREIEKNVAAGMSPEEARRRAHIQFGGVDRVREKTREARGISFVEHVWKDARVAVRTLGRQPGFTAAVVLTLALGIGANAAIFRLYDAIQLRALPVSEPGELAIVELAEWSRWTGRRVSGHPVLSHPVWERLQNGPDPFEGMLAFANDDFRLGPAAEGASTGVSESARGLFVSGDFFRVLGVEPEVGRLFEASDDHPGCGTPGAVLSHGFWQRRYGGDSEAIGSTLVLEGIQVPILGVTREGFTGLEVGRSFDVAVPLCSHPALGREDGWIGDRTTWWLTVMGRMPSNESLDAVSVRLSAASPAIFAETIPPGYPVDRVDDYRSLRLRAVSGREGVSSLRSRYGDPLIALLAVTGLVLLIACANLANLFLARGSARRREFAVRQALGASSGRLHLQLLVESLLLAGAGAGVGLALAVLLSGQIAGLLAADFTLDLSIDARLVGFVAAATTLPTILFGLLPASRSGGGTGQDAARIIRDGRSAASDRRGHGVRKALVASQVALSFVLLFGALLFTSTLRNLQAVDTGFEAEGVTIARIDFSALELEDASSITFKRDVLDRVLADPSVAAAAEVRHVPLGGTGSSITVRRVGGSSGAGTSMRLNAATPGYFEALGIPLLVGRGLRDADVSGRALATTRDATVPSGTGRGATAVETGDVGTAAAVVNETFARRLRLSANPVGARFTVDGTDASFEIVGLVPDSKVFDLREDPVPMAVVHKELFPDTRPYADLVIRSSLPLTAVRRMVRSALDGAGGSAATLQARSFEEAIRNGLLRERLLALVAGSFGILAEIIAAIGLYGVLSYLVVRRTADIGVRKALGASRSEILKMVLRWAGATVAVGLVGGGALALLGSSAARALLYGVKPRDPVVLIQTTMLFLVVAGLACYLPARRAARLEPTIALREE